ncbi:MAG TPA: hypothetical protein VF614_18540, partial [Chthoniobacteraceae bacterium]
FFTDADLSIEKVIVGGDWIASGLSIGTMAGPDSRYGTNDDFFLNDDTPETTGTLGSLVIKGRIIGTVDGTDSFRIMAPKIGKLKVGEVQYPLTAGADDFAIGTTGDVSVVDRA